MASKKVLFLTPSFNTGGAEIVILRLLRHLDRSLAQYHLGVIWNIGQLAKKVPGDIVLHDLKCRRTRYMFLELFKLMRSLQPQLIFSTHSRINLVVLAISRLLCFNTKIVVRAPNMPSVSLQSYPNGWAYAWGYRTLYPHADKIVCQSEYMRADFINNFGLDPNKLVVINNPVSTAEILVGTAAKQSPHPIALNIVSCGRLTYQKGYDTLLKAFKRLRVVKKNAHLTIIGDGPLRDELKALSVSLDLTQYITWTGVVENPYPYFKFADLFVLPSRWEGFPNVLVEALGCGTPAVATDCPGGNREIIKEGVNGWLAPIENPEGLAATIIEALIKVKNLRERDIRGSISHLSMDVIIGKYHCLFRDQLAS